MIMTSSKPTTEVSRETQLISAHGYFLRVTDDTVEGIQQRIGDVYTTLEMISVAPGEIMLRGKVSNKYIGMDSKGDLLTYSSSIDDCYFKEHHNTNGYSSFESKPHTGWFLALTTDGRAKPGPKTASGQRAVEFLSRGV